MSIITEKGNWSQVEFARQQTRSRPRLAAAPVRSNTPPFNVPHASKAFCLLISTKKTKAPKRAPMFLYRWRWGELNPRAMDNGASIYGA